MITYPYLCQDCSRPFEVRRSILDSSRPACPACGSERVEQTFSVLPACFDATPRTLGGQADRNFTKAGLYEREARQFEIEQARTRARLEKDKLPAGMESVRKAPEPTWWRPDRKAANPRLVRSSPKEKQRYLAEGKI